MKDNYGTSYREKSIKALGLNVAKINARYLLSENGVVGYITITNFSHDLGNKTVISSVNIPNGTIEQVKNIINPIFDSITIGKDEE